MIIYIQKILKNRVKLRMINLENVINKIEEIYVSFDRDLENLIQNINKTNEFIKRVDNEIDKVLNELSEKEGRLTRLNLFVQIKNQLTQSYKDLLNEYREILKNKMEVNKFLMNKLMDKEQHQSVQVQSSKEEQYKEIISILDIIQRKDKNKQNIISDIINEMSLYFEENNKLNNED